MNLSLLFECAGDLLVLSVPLGLLTRLGQEAKLSALVRDRHPAVWARRPRPRWWQWQSLRFALLGPIALIVWTGVPRSFRIAGAPATGRHLDRIHRINVGLALALVAAVLAYGAASLVAF